MQDQLKTLFEDRFTEQQNALNKQSQTIFLCGFLSGVLFSYTGVVGFLVGVISGLALKHMSSETADSGLAAFTTKCQNMVDYVRKVLAQSPDLQENSEVPKT